MLALDRRQRADEFQDGVGVDDDDRPRSSGRQQRSSNCCDATTTTVGIALTVADARGWN
jgi:hypothetical protein